MIAKQTYTFSCGLGQCCLLCDISYNKMGIGLNGPEMGATYTLPIWAIVPLIY